MLRKAFLRRKSSRVAWKGPKTADSAFTRSLNTNSWLAKHASTCPPFTFSNSTEVAQTFPRSRTKKPHAALRAVSKIGRGLHTLDYGQLSLKSRVPGRCSQSARILPRAIHSASYDVSYVTRIHLPRVRKKTGLAAAFPKRQLFCALDLVAPIAPLRPYTRSMIRNRLLGVINLPAMIHAIYDPHPPPRGDKPASHDTREP